MNVVRVIRSGLSTTVQDLGRPHHRHFGIVRGGAMDRVSHELANRLAGNQTDAATLEMTLSGDELEWSCESVIAITGADLRPVISSPLGEGTTVPQHRPVLIRAGTRIRFHTANRGCRCCVAVAGGFAVPLVMGSRSTWLRAGIGGHCGRTLKSGDELPLGIPGLVPAVIDRLHRNPTSEESAFVAPQWFVRPLDLAASGTVTLRVIRGAHFDRLTAVSCAMFRETRFEVSAQSDRMGYRLTGSVLSQNVNDELLSEGISEGTMQLSPDGNLILHMADSAPTGGYPRIAHVIAADLPVAAQTRPGLSVQFQEVTLTQAHTLLRQQRDDVRRALMMADLTNRG